MDHAATLRRCYALINTGDVDGFGDLLAESFVEHEETPGFEPTKDGVKAFFRSSGPRARPARPDSRVSPPPGAHGPPPARRRYSLAG
jgi:ketosteroid isomerase-like protein